MCSRMTVLNIDLSQFGIAPMIFMFEASTGEPASINWQGYPSNIIGSV